MEINEQAPMQKKRKFISSEAVLRYFIGTDEGLDTLIICKKEDEELFTTDLQLHEAFGSIKTPSEIKPNKIAKFFENVDVISFRHAKKMEKPVLSHERVEELRGLALSKNTSEKDSQIDSKNKDSQSKAQSASKSKTKKTN